MKRRFFKTNLAEYDGERDFPCRLVESTTPGHFHLYMDRAVTWEQYEFLLAGFRQAKLIEVGFFRLSAHRDATFVRKPGVAKQATDSNSAGDVGPPTT